MYFKHGFKSHPLYPTWSMMKARCYNRSNKSYPSYGGRGIVVCKEWLNSPAQFIKDMGPKPTTSHSIERTNNELGYYPDNCIWGTRTEQARNTRMQKNNTSGITGVRWMKTSWISEIKVNGKRVHLGSFATIAAATRARKEGEIKYWNTTGES